MSKNDVVSAGARSSKLLPEQEKILQDYLRDNALNGRNIGNAWLT